MGDISSTASRSKASDRLAVELISPIIEGPQRVSRFSAIGH
jgi:hypothetical protein